MKLQLLEFFNKFSELFFLQVWTLTALFVGHVYIYNLVDWAIFS